MLEKNNCLKCDTSFVSVKNSRSDLIKICYDCETPAADKDLINQLVAAHRANEEMRLKHEALRNEYDTLKHEFEKWKLTHYQEMTPVQVASVFIDAVNDASLRDNTTIFTDVIIALLTNQERD